jgi:hypothetical protein
VGNIITAIVNEIIAHPRHKKEEVIEPAEKGEKKIKYRPVKEKEDEAIKPGGGMEPGHSEPGKEDNEAVLSGGKRSEKTEPLQGRQDNDWQREKENIGTEGIFIQHAGLVLLHPFVHAFFKRLKLVKDGEFVDPAAQQKAICLLYYLGTGLTEAEEAELVVHKLLSGYPVSLPVEKYFSFTAEELTEANELISAVIAQWEILKKTSVEGLRESFLQRGGKLFTRNDNLCLQVEASSIDMLLDHLPWNLSMIKLPWMKEMLRVEWR